MRLLFTNANIFTARREALYARAMLVEDGVVRWIGTREESQPLPGSPDSDAQIDELIDLKGRTVIPGFVDAHMHPMMLAEYSRQIACLPPRINSIRQLIEEIGRAAEHAPKSGWVRGWGYDEGKYEEKRQPNRYDLDRGCRDLPILLVRSCEHIRCVNSKALEIAGITRDTPDPPGGTIDRDERGEPTGILRESARDLVLPYIPGETEDEMADALVDLGRLLTAQGIAAISDMGNLHAGGNYEAFEEAVRRGFRQRVSMYYMWDYFKDDPDFDIPEELMDPFGQLRIAGLKLIGDGSISGRTAWLHRPYMGTDRCGMSVYSEDDLESALAFAKRRGCQMAVHAMGGRAIDRIIDRIYEEKDWMGSVGTIGTPGLRVEHVTEPSVSAMEKAAEKGFAFVSQPIFEYCEIETYRANMDTDRLRSIYPYRSMLEHGVDLAFSTDAPATSWAIPSDPFSNLKAAVTRRAYDGTDTGQDQRLDIETAVILYTANAARISGFGNQGQLRPGYRADFAVLSDDLFSVDPADIDRVCAEETYIGGERQ